MSAVVLLADTLENEIRNFLTENEEGGRFALPDCTGRELAIPLMLVTFEEEGWDGEYDYDPNTNEEWIDFQKPEIVIEDDEEFLESE